ncbi:MAG: NAD(P)-binding protein [Myxococcales bacterium]|nr:NAD(P)-binding protein [Myxococcales bacterium]
MTVSQHSAAREKVVIVGGGLSAMSAASALTAPEQENRYDVTVYQMGWRLGGKAASGVNPDANYRIEEHGLHVLFGCYHNTFNWMKQIYGELDRDPSLPLASFDAAFKKAEQASFMELVSGKWERWPIEFPSNNLPPGRVPRPWDYVLLIMEWFEQMFGGWLDDVTGFGGILDNVLLRRGIESLEGVLDRLRRRLPLPLLPLPMRPRAILNRLLGILREFGEAPASADVSIELVSGLIDLLMNLVWRGVGASVDHDLSTRRRWIMAHLAATTVKGILVDRLFIKGFGSVDDLDYRAWFRRHANIDAMDSRIANDLAFESAPIQALYDAAFAYQNGDPNKPRLAAGTALRISLRLIFGYSGAISYHMQAGMGDTIFAPTYQVLVRRGVKFRFFSRVRALELNDDKKSVARIKVSQQVRLKGDYEPLIKTPAGLSSWPSAPILEQLEEDPKALKGSNLELYLDPREDTGPSYVLEAQRDFDHVVLAVTHACLPELCAELIENSADWKRMTQEIESVQTQALQIWLDPSKQQVTDDPFEVVGAYQAPYSTVADFSHLLAREHWPATASPQTLLYSCGVLESIVGESQQDADERVEAEILRLLKERIGPVLPLATRPDDANCIDWKKLHARRDLAGDHRLKDQYRRANMDPVERYVLSIPGTQNARLAAEASGFGRLVLAGTWVDTGLNISACETAVMSGMQASRAISKWPQQVVGERDFDD